MQRAMNRALTLAAAATVFAVGGCGTLGDAFETRQNEGPCPVAASLYDASRIVDLQGGEVSYGNIAWTGEITGVTLYCRYVGEEPILASVDIDFAFGKGPAATGNSHEFPYFVTVTRRGRALLEKETYTVEARFADGERVTGQRETIRRIEIPRYDQSISGANFEVLVGFVLTPEQLAFNREGRRFRLDAGDTEQ